MATKYEEIANDLLRQIDSGSLAPGAKLPAEAELSKQYNASRNTVREAIRRLDSLGRVQARQGQGTFVTEKIDPFVTVLSPDPKIGVSGTGEESATNLSRISEQHQTAEASPPKIEIIKCPAHIAARLRVPAEDQVISRHQVRYIDGVPWLRQTSFYPFSLLTDGASRLVLAEDIPEGTVKYLASALGLRQTGFRDWVTARGPDGDEQEFFGLPHDAAVFEVFRTGFDQHGTPMRVTVTVYPAERNQLMYNFGDIPEPQYNPGDGSGDQA
jgi:GntR family transcriptional regulator